MNKKSRITLFLSGAKNSVIEEYQAKYKDALEIVADPLGLYFREYKIEANNTYIFLDSKGVQLDNGDIYNLQSNTIETFINNKDSTKLELLEIKTIKFAKNNSPIAANRYAKGLYSKKNNKYYIADTKGFRLNIFDSTGALINYIMFPQFNKYYNITCQQISWLEDDKTIFLHLSGDKTPDFTFSNTYLRCDIDNNTFTDIKLPYLDSIRTQLLVYTSPYINAYVAVSNFSKEMKDQDLHNIKPLSYFDSNCVMKLNFGRVMDVYYQYDLRLAYMELLTFSNQYIFSLQAYTKLRSNIEERICFI
ncbi:MAG TPA: hypothetical protein PLE30_09115 [Candidatus Kapabacteria bacterium]|nr:hypothetical protein [Candidatus Kapabacteria bacterium]